MECGILEPRKPFLKKCEAFTAAILKTSFVQDTDVVVAVFDKPGLFKDSQREQGGVRLGVEQGCRKRFGERKAIVSWRAELDHLQPAAESLLWRVALQAYGHLRTHGDEVEYVIAERLI